MAPESVSFRISRNAEDLAHTVHALSQRLVKLEQRLAGLELQLDRRLDSDPQEIASLANVERLVLDCRALLEMQEDPGEQSAPLAAAAGARGLVTGGRMVRKRPWPIPRSPIPVCSTAQPTVAPKLVGCPLLPLPVTLSPPTAVRAITS